MAEHVRASDVLARNEVSVDPPPEWAHIVGQEAIAALSEAAGGDFAVIDGVLHRVVTQTGCADGGCHIYATPVEVEP